MGAAESQPYKAQEEGDDLELPPGAPKRRRRSAGIRVDIKQAGTPVFVSEARGAMSQADVEMMNALNCHSAAYVVVDKADAKVLFISDAFEKRIGVSGVKAHGKPALEVLQELVTMDEETAAAMAHALKGEKDESVAIIGKAAANSEMDVFLQWFMSPMHSAAAAAAGGGGDSEFVLCVVQHAPDAETCKEDPSRNLAQRLRISQASTAPGDEDTPWTLFKAYKRLCETDQALVDILQERGEMFCITDPALHDNPIIFVSDGFIGMTKYQRYEITGINCRFLQGEDTSPEDVKTIRDAIDNYKHARVCLLNYTKTGIRFVNQFNISVLRDAEGQPAYFIGVQIEVEDAEIMPFPNTRQSMAEMLIEAEREEMMLSY